MQLKLIIGIYLMRQATAFAPTQQLLASTARTARKPEAILKAGFDDYVGEKLAGITDAITSFSAPPDLQTLANEVSQAMLHALPPGVDESALQDIVAAAATPYHLAAIGIFALASSFMLFIIPPEDFSDAPFEPGTNTYNPKASEEFYRKRPLMVVKRVLKLALLTASFNTGILFDWLVLGKLLKDEEYTALKQNEPKRAKQSLVLCEQLGPTFISECFYVMDDASIFFRTSLSTQMLPISIPLSSKRTRPSTQYSN